MPHGVYAGLILDALRKNGGEIRGIFSLAQNYLGTQNVRWIRFVLGKQVRAGEIEIVDAGQSKPKIIRLKKDGR